MAPGTTGPKPARVFISYAHSDPAHADRVLTLAYALAQDGIAVELDRFHATEATDWPRWCEECLRPEHTDFVLLVCTAEYKRRIEGRVEKDQGRGVFWEGGLIYSYLYEDKANERFVPILLDGEPQGSIPRVVKGTHRFCLNNLGIASGDPGYAGLYRLLTRQPEVLRPDIGPLKPLPPRPLPALADPDRPSACPPPVAVWAGEGGGTPLCLGLRLDARHVLTPKGPLAGLAEGATCTVQPPGAAPLAARLVQRHQGLDLALLRLVDPAPVLAPVRLAESPPSAAGAQLGRLWSLGPDVPQAPPASAPALVRRDPQGGDLLVTSSEWPAWGGVVEVAGWVVGLLSPSAPGEGPCRATDLAAATPWLDALPQAAGGAQPPQPAAAPAASPGYRAHLDRARLRVAAALGRPGLGPLATAWGADPLSGFDPTRPDQAIRGLFRGFYKALHPEGACVAQWRRDPTPEARQAIRHSCRDLLAELAKLAVDPARPGAGPGTARKVDGAGHPRMHVHSRGPFTAETQLAAHYGFELPVRLTSAGGRVELEGAHAAYFHDDIAVGVGRDWGDALAAKLWALIPRLGPQPQAWGEPELSKLQAAIANDRELDEVHYRVVAPGRLEALTGPQATAAQGVGVPLVLYEGDGCPDLLCDEAVLQDLLTKCLLRLDEALP